jgi:SSS family solute:Na+ symporter
LPAGTVWELIAEVNFLHFAVFLFLVCTTILIGVSFMTKAPSPEQIRGLTFGTRHKEDDGRNRVNIVLSLLLALTIGILWYVFA